MQYILMILTSNKHTTMKNSSDNLQIFHQNIRGLYRKTDELTTHWENFFPIFFVSQSTI